ncbi:MAG: ParA family protein [Chloroflexi bacterium]|nr:ParA family protein [Chloroflexota bacterium]
MTRPRNRWAFMHQKGGVAKTTSAAAVAGALVELGYRVLAIDLDPQGSLTLALGFRPQNQTLTIAQVLQSEDPDLWRRAVKPTEVEGLDLLPANATLTAAMSTLSGNYMRLSKVLDRITDYDFLIMDTPPVLRLDIAPAVALAADLLLIPTQAEYFSVYAIADVLKLVRWARQSRNPDLMYRIFITMFQKRNRAHALLRARLEATFGHGLCHTVIGVDTKLREAAIAGLPITHFAPRSRAAQQYRALTQEVLAYVQEQKPKASRAA